MKSRSSGFKAWWVGLAVTIPVVLAATGALAQIVENFEVRYWDSPTSAAEFPERSEPQLEHLWLRPSFGIAFSGGGTRAATATWGQLRGLSEEILLLQAQYLSAVSGGAWTTIPYSFVTAACEPGASKGKRSCSGGTQGEWDDWFLGQHKSPADLTEKDLEADSGSWVSALSKTQLIRLYLSRLVYRGDETYSRALGKRFLDGIGQYECLAAGCATPPKHRYFVTHDGQRDRIADRSGGTLTVADFTQLVPGRPFPIAGGTLLAKKVRAGQPRDLFPFEMTPLYVGVPQSMTSRFGGRIGGGFVEAPAWDAVSYKFGAPEGDSAPGILTVEKHQPGRKGILNRYRFTLSDVLGGTGGAPVLLLRKSGLDLLGFPEWNSTAIGEPVAVTGAREFAHGDGGHIDNLGLLPLLSRQVENILVFINAPRPFFVADAAGNFVASGKSDLYKVFLPSWLTRGDAEKAKRGVKQPLLMAAAGAQIEPTGGIERALLARKLDGLPLVHCDTYRALANERFGIRQYEPNVCWVVLDRVERWISELPSSGRLFELLRKKKHPFWGRFKGFPHYGTFFHRWFKLRVIDLGEEQVNAMAYLTEWTVHEIAPQIREHFGLDPGDQSTAPPLNSLELTVPF
ncbi:MAG: hypothetical protein IH936_08765 [Acidobacteria bacterium]|nr:hypothetical protein [Acidobacteriota bacterium]